ncbi:Maf family protein [Idiomarina xiamenensis]|uniref:dTTP/UTP pyrophosphatase n=1 Tax=Idiomarina xiamenensis 10-D-4 TaxID=740709 RepID=K2JPF9_9GAMM|nr:Maf family protein [Idiomarina xiamenensis]EKE85391.1 Maf-like protein [Idiomarina xiamenensis 10-D-4]
MKTLYLASASPRRQQLLSLLRPQFHQRPSHIVEQRQPHEAALPYVQRLAAEKAAASWTELTAAEQQQGLVLGADTIIVCDQQVLEKPRDKAHFMSMMSMLSDRTHQVVTAIYGQTANAIAQQQVVTDVSFASISEAQAEAYWASGEPQDKAAGYAIQGGAGRFVTQLSGSYFAVVGLPLYETEQLLLTLGG